VYSTVLVWYGIVSFYSLIFPRLIYCCGNQGSSLLRLFADLQGVPKLHDQSDVQEVPFASCFEEDDLFEQSMTEDFFQGQSNNSFYQCCGSGMFIPDPNFFHPGFASKNLSIFTQNIVSKLSEIGMILVVHPGSGFPILIFYPSRIPDSGIKKAPDPGSGPATLCFMLK
jgi:hypothetical protein